MIGSKVREELHKNVYCNTDSIDKLGELIEVEFDGKADVKNTNTTLRSLQIKIKASKQKHAAIDFYCYTDLAMRKFLISEDCRASLDLEDDEIRKDYNELINSGNFSTMYNAVMTGNVLNVYL